MSSSIRRIRISELVPGLIFPMFAIFAYGPKPWPTPSTRLPMRGTWLEVCEYLSSTFESVALCDTRILPMLGGMPEIWMICAAGNLSAARTSASRS